MRTAKITFPRGYKPPKGVKALRDDLSPEVAKIRHENNLWTIHRRYNARFNYDKAKWRLSLWNATQKDLLIDTIMENTNRYYRYELQAKSLDELEEIEAFM